MVKNYFFLLPIFLLVAFSTLKAQEMPVLSFSIPTQNQIKFNRFIQNPTYSFVGEDNTYISMYHRNQWIEFNDSPKAYMLSYTGRFNEKTGLGIGIYQQNTGVITSFGAIGNFAQNIRLNDNMNLTLGFNLAYYSSGVDNNRTITAEDDPLLLSFRNTSLVTIKPGLNISYKQFDLGVYAENLVDYDFKTSQMASEYIDRTYSSQLMYTHDFNAATGLFEGTDMRLAIKAEMTETFGTGFGGSILTNFPRMGWIQLGVDNYYGIGAGAGVHISKRLSIGYTYERTIKEGLVNLGPTHEVNIVFAIQDARTSQKPAKSVTKTKATKRITPVVSETVTTGMDETTTVTTTTQTTQTKTQTSSSQSETNGHDNGLESLRKTQQERIAQLQAQLKDENQYLLDILLQENELNKLKKADLETRIRNLEMYVQRQQQSILIPVEDIQTIVLRSANPVTIKIDPRTMDDLKSARNGYYLVSKPKNSTSNKDFKIINGFSQLPDAVLAYNIKYAEAKNEDLYIIHVDNPEFTNAPTNFRDQQVSNALAGNASANPHSDNVTFSGLGELTPRATKSNAGTDGNSPRQEDAISRDKVLGTRLITTLPINQDNLNQLPEVSQDPIAVTEKPTIKENPETTKENTIKKLSNTIKNEEPKSPPKPKKVIKQYDDDYDLETRRNTINLTLLGVEPGYYIVANVFSQFSNAENFLEDLKSQGLDPSYFKNPRNKYTYVYLKHFNEWREASKSFHSKLNKSYAGKIWIMSINID
ncbi:PorP/SprF family type IX secretion system membrane protein [Bizionia myxarmorum]|uniref:Type IX secretion system membrane protein PorP/SprF n=1 Tax=Bizionia myxarmorum TaxID=291186 RepID=A0A5D0QYM8_9FLAO|nr:PorP/SprF family type IX secretion system membrane protein [Bizionia myxarmorum]TYB74313.1 type IX secretion system membrane protein PorP/SprF [Bizionia myxarmorum]